MQGANAVSQVNAVVPRDCLPLSTYCPLIGIMRFPYILDSQENRVAALPPGSLNRAYLSDLDLSEVNTPLDIIKAFVNVYGLAFQLGNLREKFAQNEIIEIETDDDDFILIPKMRILNGQKGDFYLPLCWHFDSELTGTNGKKLHKIVLAFAININKYIEALRKHNVIISPTKDWQFPRIGDF